MSDVEQMRDWLEKVTADDFHTDTDEERAAVACVQEGIERLRAVGVDMLTISRFLIDLGQQASTIFAEEQEEQNT